MVKSVHALITIKKAANGEISSIFYLSRNDVTTRYHDIDLGCKGKI